MAYRFFEERSAGQNAYDVFHWLQAVAGWEMVYAEYDGTSLTEWVEHTPTDLVEDAFAVFKFPDAALAASGVRLHVAFTYSSDELMITPVQALTPLTPAWDPEAEDWIDAGDLVDMGTGAVIALAPGGVQLLVHTTAQSVSVSTLDPSTMISQAWAGYLRTAVISTSTPVSALGAGEDPYPGAWLAGGHQGKVVSEGYTTANDLSAALGATDGSSNPLLTPLTWNGTVPRQASGTLQAMETKTATVEPRGTIPGLLRSSLTVLGVLRDIQSGAQYYGLGPALDDTTAGLAVGPL